MYFHFTVFNNFTLAMMGLTIWMAIARFTASLESNWPLLYYAGLVVYMNAFEATLNNYWVFVGVISGLFLRFEFMGGVVLKAIRAVELGVFAYVLWRCGGLILAQ